MNRTTNVALNDPRVINAWAFFDWANSSYALTIAVAIFPAYYAAVTFDEVVLLGMRLSNSALYAFAISASYLVLAFVSPLLSGIADYGGRKMFFMRFFTVVGALACISLFFFQGMDPTLPPEAAPNRLQVTLGTFCFILATMGFAGSLVFYNAYLPEIASEDRYDSVSARGFSYGYIGSVLLLLLNLAVIQKPEWFGLPPGDLGIRLSFVMVGLWWLGFALIPFRRLPKDPPNRPRTDLLRKGVEELRKVWRQVRAETNIQRFLGAFFAYSAGVQTVLYLAATFAEKELHFPQGELIAVVLILQIVAIGGAWLFARVSDRRGNKFSLLLMLGIWTSICAVAYFITQSWQFYVIAGGVGLVMGGIQSLSRSTYSKLLPEDTPDTASFFSFYDILEKVAIVLGTFMFGLVDQLFGMRNSVLFLALFFLIGMAVLSTVRIQHAREA